jgi:hypothetical protein
MTSFTVIGKLHDRFVEITWIDGVLSGDPELVRLTEHQATAAASEDQLPGASGGEPSASTDHLSDPHAACELICLLLEEPEIVSGTLPPLPEQPQE